MALRYAALALVAANIIIFGVQLSVSNFTDTFLLESAEAAQRPWTLLTSMFLHGSLSHLLGNMFALALFGIILEGIIGTRRFLGIYFAGGLVASLVSLPFYAAALGASGALFAVLGALAALRPAMFVWVYGVPMPMAVAAGFWLLLDVAGVFFPSNVANVAHIGGLAFGAAASVLLMRRFAEWRRHRRKRALSDKQIDEWEERWM